MSAGLTFVKNYLNEPQCNHADGIDVTYIQMLDIIPSAMSEEKRMQPMCKASEGRVMIRSGLVSTGLGNFGIFEPSMKRSVYQSVLDSNMRASVRHEPNWVINRKQLPNKSSKFIPVQPQTSICLQSCFEIV